MRPRRPATIRLARSTEAARSSRQHGRREAIRGWTGILSGPVLAMVVALALGLWAAAGCGGSAANRVPADARVAGRPPRIDPDYQGCVIPPNLAPLNFVIREPGARFAVTLSSAQGAPLELRSRSPSIRFPLAKWAELLAANHGQPLVCQVSVQDAQGAWERFLPLTNTIAPEAIDDYLVYRKLTYQFSMYASGTIGIYQRRLGNFDERTVLRVKDRRPGSATCVHCHTFRLNQPDPMLLHIRNELFGKPMLIAQDKAVTTVDKPMGPLSWHPNGRLVAFSLNRFSMLFHSLGRNEDVFDGSGDIGVYYLTDQRVGGSGQLAQPDWLETWPAWSPDGRYLYFCRGPKVTIDRFLEAKYDLMRLSYDADRDAWGEVETVLLARDTGLSLAQPSVSPDGRFVLLSMVPYSSFPATQPGSDLYLLDLTTRRYRALDEVNSERSEGWHSWSSNGRWIVFSTKRRDGMLTRPHFSYFDGQGRCSKPFILPQEDPTFYDSCLQFYHRPELITGPVRISERRLCDAIFHPTHRVKPVEKGGSRPPEQSHHDAQTMSASPSSPPAR